MFGVNLLVLKEKNAKLLNIFLSRGGGGSNVYFFEEKKRYTFFKTSSTVQQVTYITMSLF